LGVRQQRRAGLGQLHACTGALEQLHAQLFFKRLDVPGQRRLRDVQPLGRPADVALFCGDDEKLEPTNIHANPSVKWDATATIRPDGNRPIQSRRAQGIESFPNSIGPLNQLESRIFWRELFEK
jgi:hypothetical protein